MTITNPILPGFNADPSALAVGEYVYVATSTFNWMPAVSLYRSKNLRDWELRTHILDRVEQIDLRGNPASCGVWAPHISYNPHTRLYYLAYTNVRGLSKSFFDLNNYVVTSPSIEGPWSDPVYLNSSGFDPSLFHDDDGKSWLLNLAWEFRQGYRHPGPMIIQQIDPVTLQLLDTARELHRGDPRWGCGEGPQLYKRGGFYYLVLAEGGTGYGHAVTVYRSRELLGTYEANPAGPLLTSRSDPFPGQLDEDPDFLKLRFYNPRIALQKAGHGSLVERPDGTSWLFHLCARPVLPELRCTLNRETAVQALEWLGGWPRLRGLAGGAAPNPSDVVEYSPADSSMVSDTSECSCRGTCGCEVFSPAAPWPVSWYSLRIPVTGDWCRRTDQGLLLKGMNSPYSAFDFSLIARRVQHFSFTVETRLDFPAPGCRHMAGLILLTGNGTFYYARKYYSESLGSSCLGILVSENGTPSELQEFRVPLAQELPVVLRAEVRIRGLQFFWGYESGALEKLGPVLDATILSDEFTNNGPGAFDGTFCGVTVQDLDNHARWAGFAYVSYEEIED